MAWEKKKKKTQNIELGPVLLGRDEDKKKAVQGQTLVQGNEWVKPEA